MVRVSNDQQDIYTQENIHDHPPFNPTPFHDPWRIAIRVVEFCNSCFAHLKP
jgi:hypothetical protein